MHCTPVTHAFLVRPFFGVAAACLFCCAGVQAQAVSAQAPADAASAAARSKPEPLTENIRVEDASTRIDEVRVGGETRSITVQPKGGMPSYQVAPATGDTRWKVLGF